VSETKRGGLKVKGKYMGVVPKERPDAGVPGSVYADRAARGGWEDWDVTREDDGTYTARNVNADAILTIMPDGTFHTRPKDQRQAFETLRGGLLPPEGQTAILAVVANGVLLGAVEFEAA
jgi:hypothetical protein